MEELSLLYINEDGQLELTTQDGTQLIVVGLDSTYFNDVFSVIPK